MDQQTPYEHGGPSLEAFHPIPVGELELSDPESAVRTNVEGHVSVLIRMHNVPLGNVSLLGSDSGSHPDLPAIAAEKFTDALRAHLRRDGQPVDDLVANARAAAGAVCSCQPSASSQFVTVIVCTLGEDSRLRQTVDTVLGQTHTNLELIVVDNKPESGGVTGLIGDIADPRLRIVSEPRRGLSVARNTGLAAAKAPIVAYTDDDAFADPQWIRYLIQPFGEHPDVACVTGQVLPAELATEAQMWFEEFGAFEKGADRTVWNAGSDDLVLAGLGTPGVGGVLFPYSAGVYGSGNNMAFRADWLRSHGAFDVALGAGTLSRGGEDLDAFLTVIVSGATIVYEPHALIRHYARSDAESLRRQMYGYGSGMCAVIAKHLVASPRSALRILARVPAGLRRLLDPGSEKNEHRTTTFPKELQRAELSGYLAGPVLYVRSRLAARRGKLSRTPASPVAT